MTESWMYATGLAIVALIALGITLLANAIDTNREMRRLSDRIKKLESTHNQERT